MNLKVSFFLKVMKFSNNVGQSQFQHSRVVKILIYIKQAVCDIQLFQTKFFFIYLKDLTHEHFKEVIKIFQFVEKLFPKNKLLFHTRQISLLIFITSMRNRQSDQQSRPGSLPRINSTTNSLNYESPFAIPDDAEIFRMKEKQKERKREQKQRNQKLKIWEKGVKKQGISIRELNELGKSTQDQPNYQSKTSFIEAAKNAIKNRVKVNEPMHNFVVKKRQTLLFQMLIDHKREKINEFQELTKLHKKGLQRAQQMLEEDMENFNAYLAENKKQARDAIKKAETQTRSKNQKVAVIKEKVEIQADLNGKNISKKQTLQSLKKYKNFLQSLSPQLTEQQRKKRQERVESFESNQIANSVEMNDQLSQQSEEQEMYFKEPEQLASIFHSLQQSNLFLITNLKEIQQEIQEAKSKFTQKRQILSAKKNELLTSKADIQKQMAIIDQQIEQLKRTTNKDEISDLYSILQSQIIRISKETAKDFPNIVIEQKNVSALDLLKDIQKKIENQLLTLKFCKEQAPNIVKQQEKKCIAEKRELKKKKNEEELEQKALKQKAQSSPEREKRKGRPIMTRSIIKKLQKKKQVLVQEPLEEIQRRKYLT